MSTRRPDEHDSRETLHESPLLHALHSLPQKYESIDVWAEHAKQHGIAVELCEAANREFGEYRFSYQIKTGVGYVLFGEHKDKPGKLVVGKRPYSEYEIPVDKDDTDPERHIDDFTAEALESKAAIFSRNAHRELEALSSLKEGGENPPYCVQLVDNIELQYRFVDQSTATPFATDKKMPLILMDFVEPGINIMSFYIDHITHIESPKQKMDFAAAVGLQIVRALRTIHAQNYIHRDVKPENIMIQNPTNNCGFIVLADFNAAISTEEIKMAKTRTSVTIAPPEILLDVQDEENNEAKAKTELSAQKRRQKEDGEKAKSFKIDYYGLGCTMFYLCTGNFPYRGYTLEEVQQDMIDAEEMRPALELRVAGVTKNLGEIIVRLLDFLPNRRGDLLKLEAELRKIVKGTEYEETVGEVINEPGEHSHDSLLPVDSIEINVDLIRRTIEESHSGVFARHEANTPVPNAADIEAEVFGACMEAVYPNSRGYRKIGK